MRSKGYAVPSYSAPNRVEVTLQGAAIAKWIRLRMNESARYLDIGRKEGEPFVVVGGAYPIIIEMSDALGLPHLDPDTRVEILMLREAFGDAYGDTTEELDTGQLIITAVCALQAAEVPVGECSKMEVRVIKQYG